MSNDRGIQFAVQKLSGNFKKDRPFYVWGEVDSYDEKKQTCVVIGENGVKIPDVALSAGVCDGLIILPVVGSTVVVGHSTYSPQRFIVLFSDIDKLLLQVGESSITVWNAAQNGNQEIQFNDGSYKGLVKVEDLVTKLNNLEDDLNNLKDFLKTLLTTTVNEPGNGAPSAFQVAMNSALATYYGKKFTDTTVDDLQNKLITHGQ